MNEIIMQSGNAITQAQVITEDLYTRFTAYIDASEKTVQTYTRAIRQYAKWASENGISQPTREDILRYRDELKESHKPTTVQNYITALRLFFQWTEQEQLYPNIANHIKGAKLDRSHKKDYLTSRQVKKVMETAKEESLQGLRDYAILALLFTGGLRTIEISGANIADIRTAGDNTVLYVQGKGREEKTEYVKIMPEVEDAIRAYLAARKPASTEEPLFTSTSNNSRGKRISTRSVSDIVKQALIKAGFNSDKLTAHSSGNSSSSGRAELTGSTAVCKTRQYNYYSDIRT